jgi:hypothetical protein
MSDHLTAEERKLVKAINDVISPSAVLMSVIGQWKNRYLEIFELSGDFSFYLSRDLNWYVFHLGRGFVSNFYTVEVSDAINKLITDYRRQQVKLDLAHD